MENSYGIGVRNRYELFYNEDVDPMEILKKREKTKVKAAEKENKGKTAKPKDPVKKAAKTEPAPKTANKTSATGNQQKGPRTNDGHTNANEGRTNANSGGTNAGDGMNASDGRVKLSDREERNNRRNRPEGEFRDGPPPRFDGEGRGMGRGRGRGMGRGRGRGRGGPGGDSRGKREFDRQSGMVTTGVKSIDKREGSGSYNWGSDKDQIEEQLNDAPNANSDHDSSTENVEKPADDTGATPEGEETKEEEVVREMTLDEWKAMQGARSKPTFNIRRAGEGENQAQWKKTYILKKKEAENAEMESEGAESEEEVHHGRRKVVLDIDFQFADSPSRGRGRGRGRGGIGRGRGGDRMERGGGRGGGRGERRGGFSARGRGVPHQEAPKMDDERDFPSLG